MDKLVGNTFKKIMKHGEKESPVKSIKLKVKFEGAKSKALKNRMKDKKDYDKKKDEKEKDEY